MSSSQVSGSRSISYALATQSMELRRANQKHSQMEGYKLQDSQRSFLFETELPLLAASCPFVGLSELLARSH